MRNCNSARGFTLIELLVVLLLGTMIVGMTVQLSFANQKLYRKDVVRSRLNQNLRSALDIIGIDAREAGENLTSIFPAFEIVNGAAGAPDELILRRNLLAEVLNGCVTLAQSTSGASLQFALAGSVSSACIYANQTQSFDAWQAHRLAEGGVAPAYVFDSVLRLGQWINYESETDSGTNYFINFPAVTWTANYPVGSTGVYLIEEWRYRVQGDYLQLIINGDDATPYNVVFGVSDLQIRGLMQDGTAVETFNAFSNWTDLRAIEVTIIGDDEGWGDSFERSVTGEFFPRNVLSN